MVMDASRFPVTIQTVPYLRRNTEIYYPQVAGLSNLSVQHRINQAISADTRRLIERQNQIQTEGNTEMQGYFEIKTNERGVLSLTQLNAAYTPPMAHGMTYVNSLTFDVKAGKSYALSELFKPGSPYISRINALIRAQIAARDIQLLDEYPGIRPDQDYYLADKALVIYFQLYDITPYAYGFPMFPISVYELQDIAAENSPLDKMLEAV